MSEKLVVHSPEMDEEAFEYFEAQFVPEKPLAQRAIFGDQLMEEVDVANLPVASGGPTWTPTGLTQDATDGDKGGGGNNF